MINKSWSQLENDCPINIERIIAHAKECESFIPNKVNLTNLDKAKEDVLTARGSFDATITTLVQILHDREILKKGEDKILFAWLVDNLGRYLKKLDDEEFNLIIKLDGPGDESEVGISRVSSYSKILKTALDSLIYESLLKSTKEYNDFEETDEIKKDKKAFLYILFQVLQVTLSIMGGLTRDKTGMSKRGIVNTIPTSWQSLMSEQGANMVKEGYKEETGVDIDKFDKKSLDFLDGDLDDDD